MPPTPIDIDYNALPSVIAIPLAEVDSETHPIVQLWRICDTAELLLRLVVAISAAELERSGGLPDPVATMVVDWIERPSLGQWLSMANNLVRAIDEKKAVVPELRQSMEDILHPLLTGQQKEGKSNQSSEHSIIALRNHLAHGAGFGRAAAESILPIHRNRLLRAVETLSWLKQIRLLAPIKDGRPVVLAGVSPKTTEHTEALPPGAVSHLGGEIALVRGTGVLNLWPLQAYAHPEIQRTGRSTVRGDQPVPLIYSARRKQNRLDMTGLGSSLPVSELRGRAVQRLEQLFRLRERSVLLGIAPDSFQEEFSKEAQSVVGRTDACNKILENVEHAQRGVLWLHGFPGMGKSAVMSRTIIELQSRKRKDQLLIAYRFRASDQRSTRVKFLRYAIKQLEGWKRLQVQHAHFGDDAEKLERRLEEVLVSIAPPLRVVFLLDGLDEIARVDPYFPKLPFHHQHNGVVWLCAGRPEPSLERLFATGQCTRIFPESGLTGLAEYEVNEWLKREVPLPQRDAIVRLEESQGTVSGWVTSVWRHAEGGVPAYITLLLDDLNANEISVGQITPRGLVAYFDSLLERAGVDDPAAALPVVMAAVGLAVEAPDAETLEEVLRRAGHLRPETRSKHAQIISDALGRARAMLRTIVVADEGSYRYLPYHDELTNHLTSTPTLANARAMAAEGWRLLSLNPTGALPQARRHALATGVRQLIRLGYEEAAARLYTDLRYHHRRLEESGGTAQLLEDLKIIHALLAYRSDELFERYLAFLTRASRLSHWRKSQLAAHECWRYTNAFLVSWAGILRRRGELSKAKHQLQTSIETAIWADGTPAPEVLEDLARIEYELGYIQFLNGDLRGARHRLNKSVNHAVLAGDEVGAWIGRCVCAHFEAQFGTITFEAFDRVLRQGLACFKAKRWNPTAERWVVNALAHRFDVAFFRNEVQAAEALLNELSPHAWIEKFGGPNFNAPYRARMHMLRGNYAEATHEWVSYLYTDEGQHRHSPRTEGLARVYLDCGRALEKTGDADGAYRAWLEGISLPEDCGNHAWKKRIRKLLPLMLPHRK